MNPAEIWQIPVDSLLPAVDVDQANRSYCHLIAFENLWLAKVNHRANMFILNC